MNNFLAVLLFIFAASALMTLSSCGGEENGGENPCGLTCENGGEVLQDGDYCYCDCPPGFEGERCEIAPE